MELHTFSNVNHTNVHEMNDNRRKDKWSARRCHTYTTIYTVVSALVMTLLALVLYRLDISWCTVSVSLGISQILSALGAEGASLALQAFALLCLLALVGLKKSSSIWKTISVEMTMWALYSFLISGSWSIWTQLEYDFFWEDDYLGSMKVLQMVIWLLTTIAIAVLLNHPVLQMFGVLLGVFAATTHPPLIAPSLRRVLLFAATQFALALGCFQAGTLLQAYRIHLIVYTRRFGLACFRVVCRFLIRSRGRSN